MQQISILDYLGRSAAKYPGKAALIDETSSISFSQLELWAKAIGSSILAEYSASIRTPIMVLVDRTAATIVSFMGVIYSGNFYVPVDVHTPKQRLQLILQNLQPAMIICAQKDCKVVDGLPNLPKCLLYEEVIQHTIDIKALEKARNAIIDTDPVYTIYTSGSTGTPKGIVVSQRSVIDLAEWLTDTFAFSCDEVIGNQTPFYFDASVKDIYLCLKNSITLVIIPKKLFIFPLLLLDYLNEQQVTTILWATSAIVLVANSKVFAQKTPAFIKKVFFAGEAMYARHLNVWRKHLPDAIYINLYGPTEVTVDCTYFIVDRNFADHDPIPIGSACRNTEVFLLTEENQPAYGDEPGEICVRGAGVALGYYGEPERSAEVFVQNPLNKYYRDLIYRTGDIGRYNEYGEIVFCCRKDEQIKHMGNRIELGEIELAVSSLDGIDSCICFYDHDQGKIVLQYAGTADIKSITGSLRKQLPKYMLPTIIEQKPYFPYNANGKIDRKKIMEAYDGKSQ